MARARRTRRVAVATARQTFSQLLSDVRRDEESVIIEKGGVPVAAVVPLSVLDRDRRWAEEREQRIALLERLRRPFREIPSEELEREAVTAVTAVRQRARRKRDRPR